jgi:putative membrane protein
MNVTKSRRDDPAPQKVMMLNRKLIITLSIVIPIAVAVLFRVKIDGYDFSFLPPIYAGINGVTAVLLIISLIAIRKKKRLLHERLMKTCIGLSAVFLVMYILYHMTSDPTPYGGQGSWRYIYFFILISHIGLSLAIVPLVLFTFSRALSGDFERHRALAKFTFPIWLYVAVTGVIVYLMISPYYV